MPLCFAYPIPNFLPFLAKQLQIKHTSIRRSLVALANQEDLDIDIAIKALTELRSRTPRRTSRQQLDLGEPG
jgi:hypothetical protein